MTTSTLHGLFDLIGRHETLSPDDLAAVEQRVSLVDVPRGGFYVELGLPTSRLGVVLRGLFKFAMVNDKGTAFIAAFAGEGEFITDYEAVLTKRPAQLMVEALEDAVVASISNEDFEALAEQSAALRRLGRRAIEGLILRLVRRERQLLTLTAAERYTAFCADFRPLLGRISEKDKAAYIGVTPVSLSRLTARLRR